MSGGLTKTAALRPRPQSGPSPASPVPRHNNQRTDALLQGTRLHRLLERSPERLFRGSVNAGPVRANALAIFYGYHVANAYDLLTPPALSR